MIKIYSLIISAAFLISVSSMASGSHHSKKNHSSKKDHSALLIKRLFEKTDLSKFDRNIDSLLDKEHVSLEELELLKTQALLEALEANSYDKAVIDELLPSDSPLRKAQDKAIFKSFDERLKSLPIEEKTKTEFSSIAQALKNLLSKVKEGFSSFKKTDEMSGFDMKTGKLPENKEIEGDKNLDEYIKSKEFKDLQNSTKDVMQRFNEAIKKSIIEE